MKKEEKKLSISGMSCTNCAKGIENKLKKEGYRNVKINFILEELTCTLTENQELSSLINFINTIGYNVKEKKK